MKRNTVRKLNHLKQAKKKKHLSKQLIITTSTGERYDYFKLDRSMQEKLLEEVPKIREALKQFR